MVVDGTELTKKDIEDLDCRVWNLLNHARNFMETLLDIKDTVIDTSSNIKPSIRQMVDMVDACRKVYNILDKEMYYYSSTLFKGTAKIRPIDWLYANYITKEEYAINITPIMTAMSNFTQFLACIDNLEQRNKNMINVIFKYLQAQYSWVRMAENKVDEAIKQRCAKKDQRRNIKSRSKVETALADCDACEASE